MGGGVPCELAVHPTFRTNTRYIVSPEDPSQFSQIALVQIRAARGWLEVHAAYLHIKSVSLRCDDDVRAIHCELLVNAVADSRCQREHRRNCGGSKKNRNSGQQLPPALAAKAFEEESKKHYLSNTGDSAFRSAAAIVTCPPAIVDFNGTGLQPPACPIDAAFSGEAHILQVMPWLPM